jgi:hypothetical protein
MTNEEMLAQLLERNSELFTTYGTWATAQIKLLAGTIDDPDSFNADGGKTGALGYYPVENVSGQTIYVPSLARLQTMAAGGGDLSAIEAVLSATVQAKDGAVGAKEEAAALAQGLAGSTALIGTALQPGAPTSKLTESPGALLMKDAERTELARTADVLPAGKFYYASKQVFSATADSQLRPTQVTYIDGTFQDIAKPAGATYAEQLRLKEWDFAAGERYYLAYRQVDYAIASQNLQPSQAGFPDGSQYKPPAGADYDQASVSERLYVGYGEIGFGIVDASNQVASAVFRDGSEYDPVAGGATVVGTPIVCMGDSLTAMGYGNTLAALTGREVFTLAIGGQTSRHIVGRASATAYKFTLSGNQIVAGANTVTAINGNPIQGYTSLTNTNVQFLSTPQNSSPITATGWLGAVHGTLTRTASGGIPSTAEAYSFVPDAGYTLPIALAPNTPFIVDFDMDERIVIYWAGSNNKSDVAQVLADADAVYRRFGPDRLIIAGPLGSSSDTLGSAGNGYLRSIENALAERYPRNFWPIRRQLIDVAIYALGITPTSQDLADIANDVTPTSLRLPNDAIHPNKITFDNFVAPQAQSQLAKRKL